MTTKMMTTQQNEKQAPTKQAIAPAVDVLENDTEYLVISDLPGVRAEDVQVELNNGELLIRAPASFDAGRDLISGGSASYEYARRFRIPSGVQGDKIAAQLTNGVLELHIPKEEAKKPRQIQVRAA